MAIHFGFFLFWPTVECLFTLETDSLKKLKKKNRIWKARELFVFIFALESPFLCFKKALIILKAEKVSPKVEQLFGCLGGGFWSKVFSYFFLSFYLIRFSIEWCFRCVLASVKEGLSARLSVHPSVTPSPKPFRMHRTARRVCKGWLKCSRRAV